MGFCLGKISPALQYGKSADAFVMLTVSFASELLATLITEKILFLQIWRKYLHNSTRELILPQVYMSFVRFVSSVVS